MGGSNTYPGLYRIMDEPTNALEQASSDIFVKYLKRHSNDKILIAATHDQPLIDSLAANKLRLEKNPVNDFKL